MACYISAGHHKNDPGAVANGLQENNLTIKVRDKVVSLVKAKGYKVITDDDAETLAEYLKRIEPGEASVVVEFHFDAGQLNVSSGTSTFFADNASANSRAFAIEMALTGASVLGIPNRGAHSETESHRGRLGLVHEPGINCLVEVCFITNDRDIQLFNQHFDQLCEAYAKVITKFDDLIK